MLSLNDRRGFTLIELILVMAIIAILFSALLIAVDPVSKFKQARDTQRRSYINALMTAVYQYAANNNGSFPSGIPQDPTAAKTIGYAASMTGLVDLCSSIVTTSYIAAIPLDPSSGTPSGSISTGISTCGGTNYYNTGFTIQETAAGRITIAAPSAEIGTISVTQ